jgi:hypothetical protein
MIATSKFLKDRPIVLKASATHHQIRQLRARGSSGNGTFLVWPDGRPTERTRPLATAATLDRAITLARRSGSGAMGAAGRRGVERKARPA